MAVAGSTTARNILISNEIRAGANSIAGANARSWMISTSASDLRAIAIGAAELSPNQASILSQLPEYGSSVIIPTKSFSYMDLAALSAKTTDEFALFRSGSRVMIIRGNATSVPLSTADGSAQSLASQGWRWTAHTHPDYSLASSPGDRNVLSVFRNMRSDIFLPNGDSRPFNKFGDMVSPT